MKRESPIFYKWERFKNTREYKLNMEFVEYYLEKYKQVKNKEHPRCTIQEWSIVVRDIFENDVIDDLTR